MNPFLIKAAAKKIVKLAIQAGVADLVAQAAKEGIHKFAEKNKDKKSAAVKRNEHAYRLAIASYENTVDTLGEKPELEADEKTALLISREILHALENYSYAVEGSFNAYHKKQLAILYTRYNNQQKPNKKEKKFISLFVGALPALMIATKTVKRTGTDILSKAKPRKRKFYR
ncbi:Uncharacterised protein [Listeria grayi]|uniref:Uncharacterized protein n=1 Tax=Listeria grayi FSL F6-1183 TaxID=1265827 RepID=A0A829RB50_LISGR|nr:hypothetical protein [Listeria grayi]EUJ29831.1 hypothetical protein LMUR_01952 [Listeria grayi FSL F6-1183]VEI34348.1 Uncharacterised protein [Listeria grayi]